MTLGEWLQTWYDLYIRPSKLAENTKKMYNRAADRVPPNLLEKPLQELTVFDLRRWLLQVAETTPRAAQLDRVMLRRALAMAYKAGYASSSLYDAELLPDIDHQPRKAQVLDAGQLRAYFDAACAKPERIALAFMACGLRRSEALGVRWEAIDLASGTLSVVGQRRQGESDLSPCKTAASVRVIELPEQLIRALRRIPRPINGGWVCPLSHRQVYRLHQRLLLDAGLPSVTLHGLRHSFATAAVCCGVPIKVLQCALGHANYQITADLYADHLPEVSHVSCAVFSA